MGFSQCILIWSLKQNSLPKSIVHSDIILQFFLGWGLIWAIFIWLLPQGKVHYFGWMCTSVYRSWIMCLTLKILFVRHIALGPNDSLLSGGEWAHPHAIFHIYVYLRIDIHYITCISIFIFILSTVDLFKTRPVLNYINILPLKVIPMGSETSLYPHRENN